VHENWEVRVIFELDSGPYDNLFIHANGHAKLPFLQTNTPLKREL
jgi:hypothetical protein